MTIQERIALAIEADFNERHGPPAMIPSDSSLVRFGRDVARRAARVARETRDPGHPGAETGRPEGGGTR